jgi:hypothetical protein
LYRDAKGKQKSAGTYDTETEALARAQVAELESNPPEPVVVLPKAIRGKVTVAAYAPGWLLFDREHERRMRQAVARAA